MERSDSPPKPRRSETLEDAVGFNSAWVKCVTLRDSVSSKWVPEKLSPE